MTETDPHAEASAEPSVEPPAGVVAAAMPESPGLGRASIDHRLKAYYHAILAEPVPHHLSVVLDTLGTDGHRPD